MTHTYKLLREGKVRKIYEYDADHLIMFTTDRISAFDVVLPDTIPGKGETLTRISNFWMSFFKGIIKNHLADIEIDSTQFDEPGSAVVVKKLTPLPVEAIVRGYLIGSGWKDYQRTGAVCGISLPKGLHQADKLPQTIFTPSTKAAVGDHDENISFNNVVDLIGLDKAKFIQGVSILIYEMAATIAHARGIIIADTKFEFGTDENDNMYLIDEVLTPDSSRFWDIEKYRIGTSPESFDKQIVRDYLESLDWDKKPPAPYLPQEIIEETANKYREVVDRLIT